MPQITLDIIGRVRNTVREKKRDGWEDVVSEIVIRPAYGPALDGVEEYSHLFVLFWISRLSGKNRGMMKVHPRSRPDLPLVGIFATRTQYRPNPVALTLVRLIRRKKNILLVEGLDALNGTPVIDLKPISPRQDCPMKFRVPEWYGRLWQKPAMKSRP